MDPLLKTIGQYANIRAESKEEGPVKEAIKEQFQRVADSIETDEMGNLYILRRGSRPGTVLLSAHQDKVVYSNPYIRIGEKNGRGYEFELVEGDFVESPSFMFGGLFNRKYHFSLEDEEIIGKIGLEGRFFKRMGAQTRVTNIWNLSREAFRRHQIESLKIKNKETNGISTQATSFYEDYLYYLEELEGLLREKYRIVFPKDISLPLGTELQLWPLLSCDDKGVVRGKLDDALGLGIITHLNQNLPRKESPNLLNIFTVQEEIGGRGARLAVETINQMGLHPSRAIVIDTTCFGKIGDGPVIYKSCGGIEFDPRFVLDLELIAAEEEIPISSIDPHTFNDSTILAQGLPDVATLAIEPPIEGMHSELETTTRDDIIQTYNLLCAYLSKGDVSPLKDVENRSKQKWLE